MENDILDGLKDVGYTYDAAELDENGLEKALADGAKSIEYTRLVEWFSKELQVLFSLEEHVNAITCAEDSSSFLLELSSFLKELGCQYKCLTEGHMSERLQTRYDRCLLLDYLIAELQAARMIATDSPDTKNALHVTIKESPTAADLKKMLLLLNFPKPPSNITPAMLFGKVEKKVTEVIAALPGGGVGKPLFTGVLSEKHWHLLEQIQKELQDEYRVRREMLLKRLDVTVQSFQWSDRMKNQEDQIAGIYLSKRKNMFVEPDVRLSYLLAARHDLAIMEKTSNANVRRNTQSSVNKVMIGRVPDRGGRPSEQMPPPPEMPSWQQRNASLGGGGGGRGDGGRGGGRGSRVQGGWNQGGQDRGGYQGNRDGGGGWKDQQGGGYRGGGRGGYQDYGGRGNRGGRGGYYQDNMSR